MQKELTQGDLTPKSPKSWPGMRIEKENDIQDRNGRSWRMQDCREKGAGTNDRDAPSRSCQVDRAVH